MKRILIVGAGQSSPYLIRWLLERAEARDWRVRVADMDVGLARSRIADHPRGEAIAFDVTDPQDRARRFDEADIVVNLLPPHLELPVSWTCVEHGKPEVTASYLDPKVKALDGKARDAGVLILTEMGVDPATQTAGPTNRQRQATPTPESDTSYRTPTHPNVYYAAHK